MKFAFVALGSNLGDSRAIILRAEDELRRLLRAVVEIIPLANHAGGLSTGFVRIRQRGGRSATLAG